MERLICNRRLGGKLDRYTCVYDRRIVHLHLYPRGGSHANLRFIRAGAPVRRVKIDASSEVRCTLFQALDGAKSGEVLSISYADDVTRRTILDVLGVEDVRCLY
jgi:hypothetical protein